MTRYPSKGDYEVGYGKPPVEHRFKPGQSGNPRGRPKGHRNLKTDLAEELREKVLVREGAKERRLTKQQAMVKSLTARAIKGDPRGIQILISLIERLLDVDDSASTEALITDEERAVLDLVKARLGRRSASSASAPVDRVPSTKPPSDAERGPSGEEPPASRRSGSPQRPRTCDSDPA